MSMEDARQHGLLPLLFDRQKVMEHDSMSGAGPALLQGSEMVSPIVPEPPTELSAQNSPHLYHENNDPFFQNDPAAGMSGNQFSLELYQPVMENYRNVHSQPSSPSFSGFHRNFDGLQTHGSEYSVQESLARVTLDQVSNGRRAQGNNGGFSNLGRGMHRASIGSIDTEDASSNYSHSAQGSRRNSFSDEALPSHYTMNELLTFGHAGNHSNRESPNSDQLKDIDVKRMFCAVYAAGGGKKRMANFVADVNGVYSQSVIYLRVQKRFGCNISISITFVIILQKGYNTRYKARNYTENCSRLLGMQGSSRMDTNDGRPLQASSGTLLVQDKILEQQAREEKPVVRISSYV
eukprot:m.108209 g.108209  ORF g.108209 m.108209 type:complete len:349 (-) comp13954_c1_seq2:1141-2187(-)